jgi:hypothetical protein
MLWRDFDQLYAKMLLSFQRGETWDAGGGRYSIEQDERTKKWVLFSQPPSGYPNTRKETISQHPSFKAAVRTAARNFWKAWHNSPGMRGAQKENRSLQPSRRARLEEMIGLALGKTWENGKVRVHRYADHFKVTDLTNAGKRGKKVKVMSIAPVLPRDREKAWLEANSRFIMSYDTYNSIKNFYRDILHDYPGEIRIDEHEVRAIDVRSGRTPKLLAKWMVRGSEMDMSSTPLEFRLTVRAPLSHPRTGNAIGTQDTSYWSRNRKDAKKFYDWLTANGEGAVKSMDISAVRKLWSQLGLKYDFH